jgi:hypothetical protein
MDQNWRTSTRSGDNGACVEVRATDGGVEIRDSKDRGGPTLTFAGDAWSSFIEITKRMAYDPR